MAVAQGESVVENITVRLIARLSVAILADHVLDGVDLVAAVVRVHDDVAPASIGRLDHAHHLGGALGRSGLLATILISTGAVIFLLGLGNLAVILVIIELLLLPLLLLIASLLLRSDHGRDYVAIRTGMTAALLAHSTSLLNIRSCFRCLACDGVRMTILASHGSWHGI